MGTQQRQKRLQIELPVQIKLLDEAKEGERHSEGRLHDLSVGGCAFFHSREIPIGSRVQVKLVLNDVLAKKFQKQELTARGAICRIEKHGKEFLLSIRFFK